MSRHDIVVIGASAGGIEACRELLRRIPPDIEASFFIVIHLSPNVPSVLPTILSREVSLVVKHPVDGEQPRKAYVYVAPANNHLTLKSGKIHLGRGPRENGCRPSVDSLFRTAAYAYGERVIGIILSGSLNDGTAGLMTIKATGGLAIVQDPAEASFPSMPRSALDFVQIDHILKVADMADVLIKLINGEAPPIEPRPAEHISQEFADATRSLRERMRGELSHLTCPSCGGALWKNEVDNFKEFSCHVGHSFTPETLLQEQMDAIDTAFWRTLRQLEENIALRKTLAQWAREMNKESEAELQDQRAQLAERQANSIKQVLLTDIARLSDGDEVAD